ncbi:hypothetical protein BT69DRAFT_347859 [Atractiella rhizophila]|nr:hypothetical protein BT69DRAFT_347859 [Atractiella rhizophila]
MTRTFSMSQIPAPPPTSPLRESRLSPSPMEDTSHMATPKRGGGSNSTRGYPTPSSNKKNKTSNESLRSLSAATKTSGRPMPMGRYSSECGTAPSFVGTLNKKSSISSMSSVSSQESLRAPLFGPNATDWMRRPSLEQPSPFLLSLGSPISSTSTLYDGSKRGSIGSVSTLNISETEADDVEMIDAEATVVWKSNNSSGLDKPFGGW